VAGVTGSSGMGHAGQGIRVAVVDDDPLVRAALVMMLGGAPDLTIVGEAGDGAQALDLIDREGPDVVLMDIRMPVMDGLEALGVLMAWVDPPKVIVLTTFDADEYVARALGGGASGFLLKDTAPAELVEAVRKVADGDPMLSPSVTAGLIRQLTGAAVAAGVEPTEVMERARTMVDALTTREREVAMAVAEGKSNADVAADLYMSVATVKAHVSRVLGKLEAVNRVQIAIRMHDAGLL
jgi:DNA-binding NarL/FixJ family response regulator